MVIVPKVLADLWRSFWRLPWFDVAWKGGLIVVFGYLILRLATAGTIGAFAAFVLFTSLFSEFIRSLALNVWNREFARVV